MDGFFATLAETFMPEKWMLIVPIASLCLVGAGLAIWIGSLTDDVQKLSERVARLEGRTDRQPDAR